MFGFGKKKPKAPRRQWYVFKDGSGGYFPEDAPFRYEGVGNSLCREGTVYPPILRDGSVSQDRSDFFAIIAETLNNHKYLVFTERRLREFSAAYKRGEKTAEQVAKAVENILTIIDQDRKR